MTTPIDPELLRLLRCPETLQPLTEASPELVAALNHRIRAGQVLARSGQPVTEPIEGGLIREDGQVLYPVRDQVPMLLIDEALPLVPGG